MQDGRLKHGRSESPEYCAWKAMKQRCYNSKHPEYRNWGGRGIRVCRSWLRSFEAFFADMGERPGPGYSLDRIDNDGDYRPGNCRWTTDGVQGNNRRDNIRLAYRGETHTLSEWSRRLGIPRNTLDKRVKTGKSADVCLSDSTLKRPDLVTLTYQGETLTLSEWSERLGINRKTINTRYYRGLPPDQCLYVGNLPRRTA